MAAEHFGEGIEIARPEALIGIDGEPGVRSKTADQLESLAISRNVAVGSVVRLLTLTLLIVCVW